MANQFSDKLVLLESELTQVKYQISRLERQESGGYTAQVAKSFPLGMVGGSGRNTSRLNKRREKELDKTIRLASLLCPLYTKRDNLQKQIDDIKSGKAEQRALTAIQIRAAKADYWRGLKVGDELNIGNSNGNPIIAKKSRLSVITTGGTKWTASEVIGREAAKLI